MRFAAKPSAILADRTTLTASYGLITHRYGTGHSLVDQEPLPGFIAGR